MTITRVGPFSCAKIAGTLYAIIGLFIGACVSLISMVGGFASNTSGSQGMGAIVGIGAIVVIPILYAALGFIGSLIAAALYNLVAGMVGGVELDVK